MSAPVTVQGGPVSRVSTDLGLFVGRVVLGAVFVAHGWQKLDNGIAGVQANFSDLGIPYADTLAYVQTYLEIVGGVLLVLGFLTFPVGLALGASMVGAAWYSHRDAFFVADNGAELVLVLAAFSVLVALTGPGRLSIDGAILGGFRRRRAEKRAEKEAERHGGTYAGAPGDAYAAPGGAHAGSTPADPVRPEADGR